MVESKIRTATATIRALLKTKNNNSKIYIMAEKIEISLTDFVGFVNKMGTAKHD